MSTDCLKNRLRIAHKWMCLWKAPACKGIRCLQSDVLTPGKFFGIRDEMGMAKSDVGGHSVVFFLSPAIILLPAPWMQFSSFSLGLPQVQNSCRVGASIIVWQ